MLNILLADIAMVLSYTDIYWCGCSIMLNKLISATNFIVKTKFPFQLSFYIEVTEKNILGWSCDLKMYVKWPPK